MQKINHRDNFRTWREAQAARLVLTGHITRTKLLRRAKSARLGRLPLAVASPSAVHALLASTVIAAIQCAGCARWESIGIILPTSLMVVWTALMDGRHPQDTPHRNVHCVKRYFSFVLFSAEVIQCMDVLLSIWFKVWICFV